MERHLRTSAQRNTGIVALVLALLLFFVAKLVPAASTLLLSLKEYAVPQGIGSSPWVGLRNYAGLFEFPVLLRLLRNSFMLTVLPAALGLAAAFLLGLAVGRMPKGFSRSLCTGLLLVPAFIPEVSTAQAAVALNSALPDVLPLVNKALFLLLFTVLSAVRVGSVAGFVCAAAAGYENDAGGSAASGSGIAVCVMGAFVASGILTPDHALLTLLANPLTYEFSDSLDSYVYRNGLMNSNYSVSAACWTLKTAIQLLVAVPVSVALAFVLRSYFKKQHADAPEKADRPHRAAGLVAAAVAVLLTVLFGAAVLSGGFSSPAQGLGGAVGVSVLTALFSLLLCLIVTLLFSYGFYTNFVIPAAVLAVLLSAISNNTVGEYLFYRSMGLVNTLLPAVLTGGFTLSFAFACAFLVRMRAASAPAAPVRFFRAALPSLIAFVCLGAASAWGDATVSNVYVNNRALFGLGLLLRQAALMGDGYSSGLYGLLVFLPAVALGLLSAFLYAAADK